MSDYERRFLALLPKKWPTGPNTARSEQAYLKGAIDLTFRGMKPPKRKPFSAGGSVNHKIAAAVVYGLRYGDWQPLLNYLAGFRTHGLFRLGHNADETCTTSYLPFYVAHLMMALMRTAVDPKTGHVAAEIRDCLSGILWWLEACSWQGSVYSPGLRVYQQDTPPKWHNDRLYDALRGKSIALYHKNMDNEGGRRNKAGYPRSTAIWMTLIARERGLLDELCPHKPKIAWGLTVESQQGGMIAYFAQPVTQPEHDALLAVRVIGNAVRRWDAHTPARFDRAAAQVKEVVL